MPAFSEASRKALDTAHPKLRALFEEIVKTVDCTVICGFRDQAAQDLAVAMGKSKRPWPGSAHNNYPSLAVDAAPYPIDWSEKEGARRFYYFAGYVRRVAEQMGIKLKFGGDWDGDFDLKDQNFFDLDHFELVEERPENPAV